MLVLSFVPAKKADSGQATGCRISCSCGCAGHVLISETSRGGRVRVSFDIPRNWQVVRNNLIPVAPTTTEAGVA